jgi:hypothetical protein
MHLERNALNARTALELGCILSRSSTEKKSAQVVILGSVALAQLPTTSLDICRRPQHDSRKRSEEQLKRVIYELHDPNRLTPALAPTRSRPAHPVAYEPYHGITTGTGLLRRPVFCSPNQRVQRV